MQGLLILRVLRVLRVAKMVRLLKAFKELWLIVKGMIDALSTIFWASCLLLLCIYVVAIFCTSMIGQNEEAYPTPTTPRRVAARRNSTLTSTTARYSGRCSPSFR